MFNKKSIVLFIAVIAAVLFVYPGPTHAQFKSDFLYKFQSRWSDVAVKSDGSRIFIINDAYSRIEEYDAGGVLRAIHGNFGIGSTEFSRPQALVIDSTDRLYVLDTGNNRVIRYSSTLGAVGSTLGAATTWGSYGTSAAGTFNNPTGIATDDTSIYIADTDNNRIQKCPAIGPASSCTIWGSIGIGNGQFSAPKGITFDASSGDNRVYVADTGNNRIQWFDTSGTFLGKYGSYGASSGQFVLPYRVIAESTGSYLFVLDTSNRVQRIIKSTGLTDTSITLSSTGGGIRVVSSVLYTISFPTTFKTYNATSMAVIATMTNDIGHPVDMSLDTSGNFYINNNFTSPQEPVIQKFNSAFVQTAEWKGNGSFALGAYGPMGIGTNTNNDLYVADTDNNKIQKFTSSGTYVYTLTPGPTPGAFSSPRDVATEATGKFYVADTGNSRIVKFDSAGIFTWAVGLPTPTPGGPTPLPGSVAAPFGITVASDNKIYVADVGFHRIQRFDANGNYEASWGEYGSADSSVIPQLDTPQGMAIDTYGNIYVADTGNNRVQRFDQNGTLATRTVWGKYGTQDGNFSQPRNIAVDSSNRVFVSEVGNRRIQAFGDAALSAGLIITQSNGTTVSEGLTDSTTIVDSYTVKLKTQPSSTVLVNITVSDPTQATVTTPVLAFTQYNWNIPQTVTVVPIHDSIANGTRSVTISHKPTTDSVTGDINYRNATNISWSDVTVTINDSVDTAGISFNSGYIPSNNVPWATEGATLSNAYSITLNTKPTANVTVTLSPSAALTVDTNSFIFTPVGDDYKTPRWVHITPVHDFIAEATHSGTIYHVAASTDPNYQSPTVGFSDSSGNVLVTIQDIDTLGVIVSKSTVNVTENGATDSYTVQLRSKPTSMVSIYPTDSSLTPLVTLDPPTLTFSTAAWNVPQTVTVTAIHDFLKNPTPVRVTSIVHDSTYSADPLYNNITIPSVTANVTDSDTGGLLIFRPGGGAISVTEGGASDTYALQLKSIPSDIVNVTLTSTDNYATTSAYFYTFTPFDWNVPQYATVSAVDNVVADGTRTANIRHTLTSLDPNFITFADQPITVNDNDTAAIKITLPNGVINIAEAGPSDSYFVRLSSQPSANVTLLFDAQNQATASPTTLVFTPSDWNVDKEVVLTAIQDFIIEGATTSTVSYTGVSADPKYNGATASFTVNIADDDSLFPGVAVNETDGSTSVTKDAVTDTYTLVLTSKPTSMVKIKIAANGPDATASAGVYWFAPNVWNIPQTVNVSAKTNPSGGKTTVFSHLVTSFDPHYNGISVPTVTVTVNENKGSFSSGGPVSAPTCGKTPPYSAPNLFQITTTQTQATLYFTPIHDNITYYFIAYGYTPGDLRFGTSFQWGPYDGVIDYTVNMLTPGTKYYFMVRGGNGCATGPWSASVSATSVDSSSSSTATRTYYAPATAPSTSGGSSSGGSSSPTGGIWLTRDLFPGAQGADVRSLQEYLNSHGFILASSGAGSPGNETTYYGNLTAAAVRRFQEAHFAEILTPLGYASGTGICGSSTRNYINSHP